MKSPHRVATPHFTARDPSFSKHNIPTQNKTKPTGPKPVIMMTQQEQQQCSHPQPIMISIPPLSQTQQQQEQQQQQRGVEPPVEQPKEEHESENEKKQQQEQQEQQQQQVESLEHDENQGSNNNNSQEVSSSPSSGAKSSEQNDHRCCCCCSPHSVLSKLRSIRSLTLLILIFLFFAMMGLFLAVLLSIFLTSFDKLERSVVAESSVRVNRVLYDRLSAQLSSITDYAEWIDTCAVLTELNQVVIESGGGNRSTPALERYFELEFLPDVIQSFHRMNFIIFYNTSGHMLTHLSYDLETMEPLEVPSELLYLNESHPLYVTLETTKSKGGFLQLESGGVIRVTSAVVYVEPDYPEAVGMMVYGRFLKDETQELSKSSQMCLTFYDRSDFEANAAVTSTFSEQSIRRASGVEPSLFSSEWIYSKLWRVSPLDATKRQLMNGRECWQDSVVGNATTSQPRIASYQVYQDLMGENVLLVRADVDRYINRIGVNSFLWSYGIVCLIVIIISIVVVLFIEFAIVGSIVQLNSNVTEIKQKNDMKNRVAIPRGGTEIALLAKGVNSMLRALDASHQKMASDHALLIRLLDKVAVEEQKSRAVMNAMSDFILTINSETGVVISANKSFYSQLRFSMKKVEGNMHITQLLRDVDPNTILQQLAALVNTSATLETVIYSSLDPIPVEISCDSARLFLEDGQAVNCFVVVVRSMKERQELMHQLNKRHEELLQLADQIKFDQMMRNHEERHKFHEFCKLENSEENFLFLEAIEKYRSLRSVHERALFQHEIVETFLEASGSHPLNLSGQLLSSELTSIEKSCGDLSAFDKLETAVRIMTITDTFIRYNSSMSASTPSSDNLE